MSKSRIVLGTLAVVAIVGMVVAAGMPQGEKAEAGSDSKPLVAAFGGAPAAGNGLPATAASELELSRLSGVDPGASVHALARAGWGLFLTPADDGLCLSLVGSDGGASVNCVEAVDLVSGPPRPLATLTDCKGGSPDQPPQCGGALLYGVAGDDIRYVAVRSGDRVGPTGELVNNTYMVEATLGNGPVYLEFTDASGAKISRPAGVFKGFER